MPDNSTGGRSGNRATRDRLPPIASIVLRNVESNRSVRCSSRETPSWVMPSSVATCAWVSLARPAQLAQSHFLSDEVGSPVLDPAASLRDRVLRSCLPRSKPSRTSFLREPGEMPVEPLVRSVDQSAIKPSGASTRLVTGNEQNRLASRIKGEGEPPLPVRSTESKFFHVGMP